MAPGAGFSESRRFLKIKDDALPPWYEQVLWKWYDAPEYTENLFTLPVIAYSGEKDGQKQAADVMEAEFAKHGRKLNHIIGPNMGHDYDKASLEKIRAELKAITAQASAESKSTPLKTLFPGYAGLFGAYNQNRKAFTEEPPLLQHPLIDAAFCQPFIFVMPSGKSKSPEVDAWVKRESDYQIDRWRRTMRGDIKIIKDIEANDLFLKGRKSLVAWGDADSNSLIKTYLGLVAANSGDKSAAGLQKLNPQTQVLATILPAPDGAHSYLPPVESGFQSLIVLNSGPTFRDEHDKNNANQIPKLPDWAVIDVTTPGDAKSPGKIVAAGFYDKDWKYVDPAKQQAEFEARQSTK